MGKNMEVATESDDVRFAFGKNWEQFLRVLNPARIAKAEQSLLENLGVNNLKGKTFLDIGSGSGLFSLAARRLGAEVYSFDYDLDSVECTRELRSRYFPEDAQWKIENGSVLDESYMENLGQFDIVYSWGVLHHTGDMWSALENVIARVNSGGKLYISIYNDQGGASIRWRRLKQIYNQLPAFLRPIYFCLIMGTMEFLRIVLYFIFKRKPREYFDSIINYAERSMRGMSYFYDLIDWLGGYPFEFAKPEEIHQFFHNKGFELLKLRTCAGGHGCNEFVFLNKPE